MTKIIEHPDRLIESFTAAFGEQNRDIIESCFSQYIGDAVIAVSPEDIAEQAIAWVNSHNEFYHDEIDIANDAARYIAIHNALVDNLDSRFICDHIEKNWDANSTTSGDAIYDALFKRYEEHELLDLVDAIASDYNEVNNNV